LSRHFVTIEKRLRPKRNSGQNATKRRGVGSRSGDVTSARTVFDLGLLILPLESADELRMASGCVLRPLPAQRRTIKNPKSNCDSLTLHMFVTIAPFVCNQYSLQSGPVNRTAKPNETILISSRHGRCRTCCHHPLRGQQRGAIGGFAPQQARRQRGSHHAGSKGVEGRV